MHGMKHREERFRLLERIGEKAPSLVQAKVLSFSSQSAIKCAGLVRENQFDLIH